MSRTDYMRDYMKRYRSNPEKKRNENEARQDRYADNPTGALEQKKAYRATSTGRINRRLERKRNRERRKKEGWRRVSVQGRCIGCTGLTRWRVRRLFLVAEKPAGSAERYVWRWVACCRGC